MIAHTSLLDGIPEDFVTNAVLGRTTIIDSVLDVFGSGFWEI